jgi:hypothetical protein
VRDNVVPVGTRPSSVSRDTPRDNPPMESVLPKFIPIFGRHSFQLLNLPDLHQKRRLWGALGCREVQWDDQNNWLYVVPQQSCNRPRPSHMVHHELKEAPFCFKNRALTRMPHLECNNSKALVRENEKPHPLSMPSCSFSTANPSEYLVKSANHVSGIALFAAIKMKDRIVPRGWYGAHEHERR